MIQIKMKEAEPTPGVAPDRIAVRPFPFPMLENVVGNPFLRQAPELLPGVRRCLLPTSKDNSAVVPSEVFH